MANISDKFLKPNNEGLYRAQQSQVLHGLWTPYGVLSPIALGIWPDGSIDITYNMQLGVKFTKAQKRKIKYVTERGVELDVMHVSAEKNDA